MFMEDIEIQVFDEFTNYKEKFGLFTVRQWIFVVIIGVVVAPTYIFLPKYLGKDIVSYIILIEAGVIGSIGFFPVHDLPAEKIIPYWIRQYWNFSKPIKYMTMQEYKELKEQKKNKGKNNKSKVTDTPIQNSDAIIEENKEKTLEESEKTDAKEQVTEVQTVVKNTNEDTAEIKKDNHKKAKLSKEEKDLMKAKKKYGYLFKEEKKIEEPKAEDDILIENTEVQQEVKEETSKTSSSETEELNNKINELSDEEKKVLLKLLGK